MREMKWHVDNKEEFMEFIDECYLAMMIKDGETCVMIDGEHDMPLLVEPNQIVIEVNDGEYYEIKAGE